MKNNFSDIIQNITFPVKFCTEFKSKILVKRRVDNQEELLGSTVSFMDIIKLMSIEYR